MSPCPPGSVAYPIKAGNTVYQLAQQFNTTVNTIIALNPGIIPNALRVGQLICLPGTASLRCPPESFSYVIKPGDRLYALAQQYGTTVTAILSVNPGINPNALFVGQRICMPQVSTTCPVNNFYTIQPGDTLFQIAIHYDVSLESLQNFNPGLDPNQIIPGQRLCIPPQQPICPDNNKYVIGPGETLSSIAKDFTVRPGDILIANPRLRPSEFTPGTTICIPLRQAP